MKTLLTLLAVLLVSCMNAVGQTPFRVIGYMPSWAGDVNQVQYSKLTHINYAFLLPTSTGGLQATGAIVGTGAVLEAGNPRPRQ